ncbi:UDP-N-acetylglucosamine diphosphorylase/glucosamine-1-phosphate N-acetyltransferase [Neolewinella xylanilytica]|uniref:UDP-N-acetylglucosamine diphosphorylase/glucosamine-1-phosphate N-acetyltransferase n=1 Tax=Neolewinella xylanilytica TaxID=1514080 RepID=A0A2S6I0J4_9BACT|nr:GlmU family protein [Neolewinella xylanilytica]PPK84381.1 UDP-N-acetylglucosamine diphosphorylase/glucosamine-1-phosphate N-acetyltransferase [Neolewinella xylanilytica]
MPLLLFDSANRVDLLPLTYARPVADLRLGILTLGEKWARRLDMPASYLSAPYLRRLFPPNFGEDNLLIEGSLVPDVSNVSWIEGIPENTAWLRGGALLVARLNEERARAYATDRTLDGVNVQDAPHLPYRFVSRPADLFLQNGEAIVSDFELITGGRTSEALSASNTLIGPPENLFLEANVTLEACILNVESGPIYIGKDATVLEGCLLRGPISIGQEAVVKMGARIYGGTTVGPDCKVGGEISNVVFQGNSNKGHDGYLGNAVVGEWCNLGADTNASNLKNDYGEVKVWSYAENRMVGSGLQFHGLIMGDHSKTGINTMLNTGTVVGFSANVFGAGFPPSFIPSFSWGGGEGLQPYRVEKAMATAERMMERRKHPFTPLHRELFLAIFESSASYRE